MTGALCTLEFPIIINWRNLFEISGLLGSNLQFYSDLTSTFCKQTVSKQCAELISKRCGILSSFTLFAYVP